MSIFESNLKLFKSTDINLDFDSDVFLKSLRAIVVVILAESHDDLIISSSLSTYSVEELQSSTTIAHDQSIESIESERYEINSVKILFPNNVIRKQQISFIRTVENSKKTYNTLILARGNSKLVHLVLQWLKSSAGIFVKPMKFDSKFLIDCMNIVIDGLHDDMVRLGDLELAFDVKTQKGNLSGISIEVSHKEIIKFSKEVKGGSLKDVIYEFLQDSTSIDFTKFDLTRFKCNFLYITKDGKLKFFKGIPRKGKSDTIGFTTWDFVKKIYEIL